MKLRLDESNIMWPGRKRDKPVGERIPTHLHVLTIEEKPFVYVRTIKKHEGESCKNDEIYCPLLNITGRSEYSPGETIIRLYFSPVSRLFSNCLGTILLPELDKDFALFPCSGETVLCLFFCSCFKAVFKMAVSQQFGNCFETVLKVASKVFQNTCKILLEHFQSTVLLLWETTLSKLTIS